MNGNASDRAGKSKKYSSAYRRRLLAEEDADGAGDALQAQQVVAVGGDVDLVDHVLGLGAIGSKLSAIQ